MTYKITLNGRTYEVEVAAGKAMLLSEYEAVAPAAPMAAPVTVSPEAAATPAPAITGSGEAITAPMPGTILKVNVIQGQAIEEGEVLCILEAMKMENEITAPKAGTVAQVIATMGSSVDTGAPLFVIG